MCCHQLEIRRQNLTMYVRLTHSRMKQHSLRDKLVQVTVFDLNIWSGRLILQLQHYRQASQC